MDPFEINNLPKEAIYSLLLMVEPNELKTICLSSDKKIREICDSAFFRKAYDNKYPRRADFSLLPKEALFQLLLKIEPEEIKQVCFSKNRKVREICNSNYFQSIYKKKWL